MDTINKQSGILSNEVLMDILKQDYINVEIKKVQYSSGSTPGDHNLSEISRVNVDFLSNGDQQSRSYIIKHVHTRYYSFMEFSKGTEKENSWYDQILPRLSEMCIDIVPKCYGKLGHLLILEDLNESGYKVADRLRMLDLNHCKAAVSSLAKFHAVTHYLYVNNDLPDVTTVDTSFAPEAKKVIYKDFKSIDKLIGALNEVNNFKYDDVLKDMKPNGWNKITSCVDKAKSHGFLCLVHGDFWTTNMMFKYDKNGDIVDTKIIDFQIIYLGIPTYDLYFFLSTSVKPEVLNSEEDLQSIYSCYLESLNRTLEEIGCSSRLCQREFSEMMKETSYIGVFTALTFLPISLCEKPIDFQPPQHLTEDEKKLYDPCEKVYFQDTHRNHLQVLLDFYRDKNVI